MKKEIAERILKDTEAGYDLISEKFSQTRNRFWGELDFIRRYNKCCGRVLDFGCGNGRLIEILSNKNNEYVGVDVSQELINLAEKKYAGKDKFKSIQFSKIKHDFKKLDFPDEFFDTIYSVAVFHHIPSDSLRVEKAKELYRIMRKESYIVITVWNLWQWKYVRKIIKNWIYKILGKSDLDWNDLRISFTNNKGDVFNRYHHAFTKGDIKRTFKKAGFEMEKVMKVEGNIVFIGRK